VRRQIKSSGKTYSTLSFEEIANYAESQLKNENYKPGYREGVILINVESKLVKHFICPFIRLSENTQLIATMTKRRQEEEPYIQIRALNGSLLKSRNVEIILYHHDVLAETKEQESTEGWELIAFHAIPEGIDHMPMGPITMMRNQLQLEGGTKGEYNSNEWAESVNFWQKYAVLQTSRDN
jgi:hypothetical protein